MSPLKSLARILALISQGRFSEIFDIKKTFETGYAKGIRPPEENPLEKAVTDPSSAKGIAAAVTDPASATTNQAVKKGISGTITGGKRAVNLNINISELKGAEVINNNDGEGYEALEKSIMESIVRAITEGGTQSAALVGR